MSGGCPTHRLMMKSRDREKKDSQEVAGIWANSGGSLSVVLKKGIVLSWRDMKDHILTIFPADDEAKYDSRDDEIPF